MVADNATSGDAKRPSDSSALTHFRRDAAVHDEAESVARTDWRQIVALYDQLVRIQPSPVVQLNRAEAIAMRDVRRPVWRISTRCFGSFWKTRRIGKLLPGPFRPCRYAGWAGRLRLGRLMRRCWPRPNRNQSGNSCKTGFGS
jgi:hypothetical protein